MDPHKRKVRLACEQGLGGREGTGGSKERRWAHSGAVGLAKVAVESFCPVFCFSTFLRFSVPVGFCPPPPQSLYRPPPSSGSLSPISHLLFSY